MLPIPIFGSVVSVLTLKPHASPGKIRHGLPEPGHRRHLAGLEISEIPTQGARCVGLSRNRAVPAVGPCQDEEPLCLSLKRERREFRFRVPFVRRFNRSVGPRDVAYLEKAILGVEVIPAENKEGTETNSESGSWCGAKRLAGKETR